MNVYICQVGPVESAEGEFVVLLPACEQQLFEPAAAPRAADALRELKRRLPAKAKLHCEPALGKAGRKLGMVSAPPPRWALVAKASLAMALYWPRQEDQSAKGAVTPGHGLALLTAGSRFCEAAPWRFFANEYPITVTIAGQVYEASVMGSGGEMFGLALYPGGEGALGRFIEAPVPEEVDTIAVSFDDDPEWAAEAAIACAPALPGVPSPMRVKDGEAGFPEGIDVLHLIAALEAVAQISPKVRLARGVAEVDGVVCEATAST